MSKLVTLFPSEPKIIETVLTRPCSVVLDLFFDYYRISCADGCLMAKDVLFVSGLLHPFPSIRMRAHMCRALTTLPDSFYCIDAV